MAADAPLDMDMLAAALRADQSDVAAFVEALADKLERALPGAVRVVRSRRGLRGPKWVREISLDAGGTRLTLRRNEADAVQCALARTSGGIVLKSEEVDVAQWVEALSRALAAESQRSERARQALEQMLIGQRR